MSSSNGSRTPRVLCVDKEEGNLLARKKLLELYGCEVFLADDVHSCIRALKLERIDAVVLECHIADAFDGERLAIGIRALFPQVALIMLTADGSVPESARGCVDRLLVKGWHDPKYLIDAISELLPHRRMRIAWTA